ncbi:HAMP domain-containing sensor histidine kinase [Paenibacillus alginolyticus]|uniref:histidine kinase n=1 Tax=Paenibacillus alginolyticus TaxID=59839 RepID=A0ABT4GPH2_9BACL|nr:HAMP domain-containing sensor histidine kinase [Paenibacillus alginolyticus]MCY9698020.1 HAMP domain-containing histidine kinase [Paenibacillus alginolyticus]MEC0148075.1 HAMP domain-containing sensor histidine kinase [Paenibacillus alginolyticus]
MNRDFFSLFNWKKSIRLRLLGSLLFSLIVSFFGTSLINDILKYILPQIIRPKIDGAAFTFVGAAFSFLSFLFFFLLLFFFLMRHIVRQVRTLADGLMAIAKGDLHYRVPLPGQDELGEVAQNINYMAEQLQSMMMRERQIETSKMELITHVSHDLRTPLTSIIGYLNLLKNDDYHDLDEHKRYIHNAYNKTQQMKKLIDDLFEYTRLTSGDVNPTFRKIDLNSLLEQIIIEFEPIAQELSLTVKKDWDQQPLFAHVDVEKLVRAIDNLLMNALKFSLKPGEITVRLAENSHFIVFVVENWGSPVTKEQEKLLFERFYKAEPSRRDRDVPSGAGLGLSIANYIVELHGGRIGLKNENGHFTFFIELPKAAQITKCNGGEEFK